MVVSLKEEAPWSDNIIASVLKSVLEYIVNPLNHVCQLSLSEGHFPSDLKIAKIIHLYECKDLGLFINSWPISLLSVFPKVLEKSN